MLTIISNTSNMKLVHFCCLIGFFVICIQNSITVNEEPPQFLHNLEYSDNYIKQRNNAHHRRIYYQKWNPIQLQNTFPRFLFDQTDNKLTSKLEQNKYTSFKTKNIQKYNNNNLLKNIRNQNRFKISKKQQSTLTKSTSKAKFMKKLAERKLIDSEKTLTPVQTNRKLQFWRRWGRRRGRHRGGHRRGGRHRRWRRHGRRHGRRWQRPIPRPRPIQRPRRRPGQVSVADRTQPQRLGNYTLIRHDIARFRNHIRHIQLVHSDQRLVDRLWRQLTIGMARFRIHNRRARRYNGIILRHNLQNHLRNQRNMIRRSSLLMEDRIYRQNRRMFRQINRRARTFENRTITNTTIFYDRASTRASDYFKQDPRDIFY